LNNTLVSGSLIKSTYPKVTLDIMLLMTPSTASVFSFTFDTNYIVI